MSVKSVVLMEQEFIIFQYKNEETSKSVGAVYDFLIRLGRIRRMISCKKGVLHKYVLLKLSSMR